MHKFETVIPAEAGIQSFQKFLDPRLRGGDTFWGVLQLPRRLISSTRRNGWNKGKMKLRDCP